MKEKKRRTTEEGEEDELSNKEKQARPQDSFVCRSCHLYYNRSYESNMSELCIDCFSSIEE
jgi:nitrate/TMAO reductase-like tetraheme cytochrome c subunit